MSNNTTMVQTGGGCGCISLVLFILLVVALGWGLPTSWGKFHIDLFPPGIYLNK